MPKIVTPHEWAKDRTPDQWANHHVRVVGVLIVLLLLCAYPAALFAMSVLGVRHQERAAAASGEATADTNRVSGSGVVLSMNDTSMTVQHGAVTGAPIAAGTTAFVTAPNILARTRVGDRVTFFLNKEADGSFAIRALRNLEIEEMGKNPVLKPAG